MSTVSAPVSASPTTAATYRLTFPRVLRSEWIKLATLRSTWWAIGLVGLLTIGMAALIAQAAGSSTLGGIFPVVGPFQFTMLLAGILGVIAVTGEYSTGMIRSTLTADPIRGSVLAAKAIVVAVLLFLSSIVSFGAAAAVVTPILGAKGIGIDWGTPEAGVLPILAASFAMAVFALIGVAFGFVLRSGAGAIAATMGVLFVLPIVLSMFPVSDPAWQWVAEVSTRLPMSAAQELILPSDGAGPGALIILGAWVVAGMLAAWVALRARDA